MISKNEARIKTAAKKIGLTKVRVDYKAGNFQLNSDQTPVVILGPDVATALAYVKSGCCLTDSSKIIITDHARERLKQRLGLPKSAIERQATKVFKEGLKREDSEGSLRKYLDHQFLEYGTADNIRVYGGYLYIFEGRILITVYILPSEIKKRM